MIDDEAPLRITEAELVTLLLLTRNEATDHTAHVLGLEPQLANGEIDRAGMQTLVVRDLGRLENDLFVAEGPAQVIGAVFAGANEWLVTTVDGPDVRTAVVAVSSPQARLMFVILPTGVHEVRPIAAEGPITEVARVLAESFAADDSYAKPLNVRIRRLTLTGETDARFDVLAKDQWRTGGLLRGPDEAPKAVWSWVEGVLAQ